MLVRLLHNYNRMDVIEIFEDFLLDHNLLDDTFTGWLEDRQLQEQRDEVERIAKLNDRGH